MKQRHGRGNRSRWVTLAYALVSLVLGTALGWLVLSEIDVSEVVDTLEDTSVPVLTLALVPYFLAGACRALRWHRLLGAPPISVRRLFLVEQTGLAFNSLTLLRVLDEAVRVGILSVRHEVPAAKVLASEAMQRTLELGALAAVMGVGTAALPPLRQYWPWAAAGLGTAGISLLLLFTVGPALADLPWLRKSEFVRLFAQSARQMREDPRLTLFALLLSLAEAVLMGVMGWVVVLAIGTEMSLLTAVVITQGTRFFVSFAPGLPLGFGTMEFAATTLFGLWGIPSDEAVAFALALRLLLYVPPVVIGIAFLGSEGLLSMGSLRSLREGAPDRRPG